MTIALVVGARPNFVKIAAIVAAIRQYPDLRFRLIHTGQHYDRNMSDSLFRDLDIPEPDVNLGCGSDSPAVQTAEIMFRLAPVLEAARPDLVLVVGDVDSTLAGALVAVKMGIHSRTSRPVCAASTAPRDGKASDRIVRILLA